MGIIVLSSYIPCLPVIMRISLGCKALIALKKILPTVCYSFKWPWNTILNRFRYYQPKRGNSNVDFCFVLFVFVYFWFVLFVLFFYKKIHCNELLLKLKCVRKFYQTFWKQGDFFIYIEKVDFIDKLSRASLHRLHISYDAMLS